MNGAVLPAPGDAAKELAIFAHAQFQSEVLGKDQVDKLKGQSKEREQERATSTIGRSSTAVCLPTLAILQALPASVAPGLTQSQGASATSLGEGNKGRTPDPPQQDPSGPFDLERLQGLSRHLPSLLQIRSKAK